MFCCRKSSIVPIELPFKRIVSLDYYDCPIEGFTECVTCGCTFYFKQIYYVADENVEFCRQYTFSRIVINFNEIYEYFKDIYKKTPVELKDYINDFNSKKFLCEYFSTPITHICIADDSFHFGFWGSGAIVHKF